MYDSTYIKKLLELNMTGITDSIIRFIYVLFPNKKIIFYKLAVPTYEEKFMLVQKKKR